METKINLLSHIGSENVWEVVLRFPLAFKSVLIHIEQETMEFLCKFKRQGIPCSRRRSFSHRV